MSVRIANKWARVLRSQPIGDKLLEEFFAKDEGGNYNSYTGYTFTAALYDSFNNIVATPAVATSDATPPGESSVVTDGKVTISDVPANLPTKQGQYTLWVTQTKDDDATDVVTFIEMQITFIPKTFQR